MNANKDFPNGPAFSLIRVDSRDSRFELPGLTRAGVAGRHGSMPAHVISGQFVDLHQRRIFPAEVVVEGGRIAAVCAVPSAPDRFILPGFVDAHVHIESSMLPPAEFARLAVRHGTVATVSDPHEIANVLGLAGVEFMLENAARTAFKFCFGASPCVPATDFETAGRGWISRR